MRVTFDPGKRDETLRHRGLDMARVPEVFAAPNTTAPDDRKDYGERRYFTVGFLDGRMVAVVWTERSGTIRVISMRKANGREQKAFGPRLGV